MMLRFKTLGEFAGKGQVQHRARRAPVRQKSGPKVVEEFERDILGELMIAVHEVLITSNMPSKASNEQQLYICRMDT